MPQPGTHWAQPKLFPHKPVPLPPPPPLVYISSSTRVLVLPSSSPLFSHSFGDQSLLPN